MSDRAVEILARFIARSGFAGGFHLPSLEKENGGRLAAADQRLLPARRSSKHRGAQKVTDFFERLRLAILRDLDWQAAARKARELNSEYSDSNSAKPENVPAESGKPNPPAPRAKEAPVS